MNSRRGRRYGPNSIRRSRRDARPLNVPSHSCSGYNRGCRCDICTDAFTDSQWRSRLRRRGELPPYRPPTGEHGRVSRYNKGCRCDECRDAARVARARARANARARLGRAA